MTKTEILSLGRNKVEMRFQHLPVECLDIVIIDGEDTEVEEISESYPLAISDVTVEDILDAKKLTDGEDVKEVYSLELSSKFSSFKPGDTIGIVTQNHEEDVQKLFRHLGITPSATKKCRITENIPGKVKAVFLNRTTTLDYIFRHCLDIRCVPKKLLLKTLSEYTCNDEEKNYLKELSSSRSDLYTREILEGGETFLDVILRFPSCLPPVSKLIEILPRMLPRPYSIASSPLVTPDRIRIVFSVIQTGVMREGLCTGMLKAMVHNSSEQCKVKMFFRKCSGFNPPEIDVPLVLIGPGTGVAPFIGFLEHRKIQERKGNVWLFYGCRYKNRDYLFEKELQEYLDCGVLSKLLVAHSRDVGAEAKYVQDNIKKYGQELCQLILEEQAMVYVCGDAKNMRKDVQNAFVDVLQRFKGMTNTEATDCIKQLQREKRYLQDVWF